MDKEAVLLESLMAEMLLNQEDENVTIDEVTGDDGEDDCWVDIDMEIN
jgi:hypothetical protein